MKDDRPYLLHMLERCQRITRFIGPGREIFMVSEELQDAVGAFQAPCRSVLTVQSCSNRFEGQYELQGVIKEPQRGETFVPGCGSIVLCVSSEGDSTNFLSQRKRAFARR